MHFSIGVAGLGFVIAALVIVGFGQFIDWFNNFIFGKPRSPAKWKRVYALFAMVAFIFGAVLIQPQVDAVKECESSGQAFTWCLVNARPV